MKPKIVQVAIGAYPSNGGVFTTIGHFRGVFEKVAAHLVVNFIDRDCSATEGEVQVRISKGLLGRKYGYVTTAEACVAERALAGATMVVIHMPYRYHAGWAAAWCRRNNVPYVFVPHGAFDPFVFRYRALQKRIWLATVGRRLICNARVAIYATAAEARKAEQMIGVHQQCVVPWPTRVPESVDRIIARRDIDRKFGVSANQRILVYLGRLHSVKRPAETIRAFERSGLSGWKLIVAGPDDGYTREQLLEDSGQNVDVCGPVYGADSECILRAADALVLCSKKENFSFVVVEALAQGTPVLISSEMDIAEEVIRRDCGWVVNGASLAEIEAGLRRIAESSEDDRAAKGANGRQWVAQELNHERFARRLLSAVLGVDAEGGRI